MRSLHLVLGLGLIGLILGDKSGLIAARSGGIYDMASLRPGNQITAWGVYQDGTSKFSVNIAANQNTILLHVDFRFNVLVLNNKFGNWGSEKRVNYSNKRFKAGKEFKVTIKVSADEYQVYLNDVEIGRYPVRKLNLANAVQLVGGSRGFKWTKLGIPSNPKGRAWYGN
ncbi:congerin-2-like [Bolinopsis microptera]|uniref:congerin-2-like n=1 Tax=Bolinopsis microptera TaxID=2820187 RepID=UPI00307AA4A8